jgi:hypothetical protein
MAFRGPVRTLAPQAGLFRLQRSSVSANAAWTVVDCWLNTVALQRNILCDDAHAYAHAHAYDDDRDCYFFVVLSVVIIDIVIVSCYYCILFLTISSLDITIAPFIMSIIIYHYYHHEYHDQLMPPSKARMTHAGRPEKA